jgi:hypothetical protein
MASTMTIYSIPNMNMALGSTIKAVRSQTTLISKSLKGQLSIKTQPGILKREARTHPLQSMDQVNWGFMGSVAFILPCTSGTPKSERRQREGPQRAALICGDDVGR